MLDAVPVADRPTTTVSVTLNESSSATATVLASSDADALEQLFEASVCNRTLTCTVARVSRRRLAGSPRALQAQETFDWSVSRTYDYSAGAPLTTVADAIAAAAAALSPTSASSSATSTALSSVSTVVAVTKSAATTLDESLAATATLESSVAGNVGVDAATVHFDAPETSAPPPPPPPPNPPPPSIVFSGGGAVDVGGGGEGDSATTGAVVGVLGGLALIVGGLVLEDRYKRRHPGGSPSVISRLGSKMGVVKIERSGKRGGFVESEQRKSAAAAEISTTSFKPTSAARQAAAPRPAQVKLWDKVHEESTVDVAGSPKKALPTGRYDGSAGATPQSVAALSASRPDAASDFDREPATQRALELLARASAATGGTAVVSDVAPGSIAANFRPPAESSTTPAVGSEDADDAPHTHEVAALRQSSQYSEDSEAQRTETFGCGRVQVPELYGTAPAVVAEEDSDKHEEPSLPFDSRLSAHVRERGPGSVGRMAKEFESTQSSLGAPAPAPAAAISAARRGAAQEVHGAAYGGSPVGARTHLCAAHTTTSRTAAPGEPGAITSLNVPSRIGTRFRVKQQDVELRPATRPGTSRQIAKVWRPE